MANKQVSRCQFLFGILMVTALLGTVSCARDKGQPVIRLIGDDTLQVGRGEPFVDPSVIAFDKDDFDLTDKVQTVSTLDANKVGNYEIVYSVVDRGGNVGQVTRIVQVIHTSSSLAGSYTSTNNCLACPNTGSVQISKYLYSPAKIYITPAMGTQNSSYFIMEVKPDGRLTYYSYGSFPCNYYFQDATGTVSAAGDTIAINLALQSWTDNSWAYCTSLYIKN